MGGWKWFCAMVMLLIAHVDLTGAVQINMSHDLVSLGIAAQNLVANDPLFDSRPAFKAAIEYTRTHPTQLLTLDKGNYYFLTPDNDQGGYVFISSISDLTIDLAGSTIYFNNAFTPGFSLDHCVNFELRNFETDFLNPPYTHAQLASVNTSQRTLTYQTLPGWADPATFNDLNPPGGLPQLYALVFRGGALLAGTVRMPVLRPIQGNTLTLAPDNNSPWSQAATLSTFQAGDTIVLTARGGGAPLNIYHGSSITVSDVNVHGASAVGVIMHGVSNSTVDRVKVTPRPVTGLIAANADGIMFNFIGGQDNHLRNSYVTRVLDDAMSINSLDPACNANQTGPRTVTVTRRFQQRIPNGTALNFVNPQTGVEIPGGFLESQDPPDSNSPVSEGQVVLTFAADLPSIPANAGVNFADPALRAAGSTIEDNVVEDVPFGHGIFLGGAVQVTVQRNLVKETRCDGIAVRQTTRLFYAPPARDVTVRDNRLINVLGPGCATTKTLAAINVVSIDDLFGFKTGSANTNVAVINNFIADSGRSGIFVGATSGGSVQGNYISRWYTQPALPLWNLDTTKWAAQVLADFPLPIAFRNSTGVLNLNNQTNSGPTPAISLASVTPSNVRVGSPDTVVTLSGSFLPGSVAFLGSTPLQTTYVSPTRITARLPSAELVASSSRALTVQNPDPSGASSGSAVFQVLAQRRAQTTSVAWRTRRFSTPKLQQILLPAGQ